MTVATKLRVANAAALEKFKEEGGADPVQTTLPKNKAKGGVGDIKGVCSKKIVSCCSGSTEADSQGLQAPLRRYRE